jgi:hypothetical protein
MKALRVRRSVVAILLIGAALISVAGWFIWRYTEERRVPPPQHVYVSDNHRVAFLLPNQRLIFDLPEQQQWRITDLNPKSDVYQVAPLVFVGKSAGKGTLISLVRSPCSADREVCSVSIIVLVRSASDIGKPQPSAGGYLPLGHH